MNNKMIGRCDNCGQDYCQECTEGVTKWELFCSTSCEAEFEEAAEKNAGEDDE